MMRVQTCGSLVGAILPPRAHLARDRDIFVCQNLEGEASRSL